MGQARRSHVKFTLKQKLAPSQSHFSDESRDRPPELNYHSQTAGQIETPTGAVTLEH